MQKLTRVSLRSNDETLIRVIKAYMASQWEQNFILESNQATDIYQEDDIVLWDVNSLGEAPDIESAALIMLASEGAMRQNHPPVLNWPVDLAELGQLMVQLNEKPVWLSVGALHYWPAQRLLKNRDAQVSLTDKEAELFEALATSKCPLSRETLMHTVWGYADDVQSRTLESHMHRLRGKLREMGGDIILNTAEGYVIKT